jgi:hypothetical protein
MFDSLRTVSHCIAVVVGLTKLIIVGETRRASTKECNRGLRHGCAFWSVLKLTRTKTKPQKYGLKGVLVLDLDNCEIM